MKRIPWSWSKNNSYDFNWYFLYHTKVLSNVTAVGIKLYIFITVMTLFVGDICIDDLKKIKCKTLIIHGLKDALVPLEHPDYLHHNIKGSRYTILMLTYIYHWWSLSKTQEVCELVGGGGFRFDLPHPQKNDLCKLKPNLWILEDLNWIWSFMACLLDLYNFLFLGRGGNCVVVGFTTTCAMSAYHH